MFILELYLFFEPVDVSYSFVIAYFTLANALIHA